MNMVIFHSYWVMLQDVQGIFGCTPISFSYHICHSHEKFQEYAKRMRSDGGNWGKKNMFHQLGSNNESRIWFWYVLIVDHISKSYLAWTWHILIIFFILGQVENGHPFCGWGSQQDGPEGVNQGRLGYLRQLCTMGDEDFCQENTVYTLSQIFGEAALDCTRVAFILSWLADVGCSPKWGGFCCRPNSSNCGQVQDDMQRLDDLDLDYLKPEWGDRDSALLLQWVSALKRYPKFADYIICFIFLFLVVHFFPRPCAVVDEPKVPYVRIKVRLARKSLIGFAQAWPFLLHLFTWIPTLVTFVDDMIWS